MISEVPVYQLTVLYNQPEDAAAFDKHYGDVHAASRARCPACGSTR